MDLNGFAVSAGNGLSNFRRLGHHFAYVTVLLGANKDPSGDPGDFSLFHEARESLVHSRTSAKSVELAGSEGLPHSYLIDPIADGLHSGHDYLLVRTNIHTSDM